MLYFILIFTSLVGFLVCHMAPAHSISTRYDTTIENTTPDNSSDDEELALEGESSSEEEDSVDGDSDGDSVSAGSGSKENADCDNGSGCDSRGSIEQY